MGHPKEGVHASTAEEENRVPVWQSQESTDGMGRRANANRTQSRSHRLATQASVRAEVFRFRPRASTDKAHSSETDSNRGQPNSTYVQSPGEREWPLALSRRADLLQDMQRKAA